MADPKVPLRVAISVDSTELAAEIHDALTDMRVVQNMGVPAYGRLSFRVENTGVGLAPERITTKIGDPLKIQVDDGSSSWTIFDGLVVGIGLELDTGTSQHVVVEGYDKLYKLGRKSMVKTYGSQSPKDIVTTLAQGASLGIGTIDDAIGSAPREHTFQYATAYAFIDRLVRDAGCEWFVEEGKLNVRPRAGASGTHRLKVGENLQRFSARFSAAEHVEEVTVTGWDVKKKEAVVGTATFAADAAKSTNGMFTNTTLSSTSVGGTMALSIPRPVIDKNDADGLAKGILDRRSAELLRARGEAQPSPHIKPGVLLELDGLGSQWDGNYYCTGVEHTFGGSSLRTFFEVGPTEPESLLDIFSGGTTPSLDHMLGSLTVGIVTNNKDDEGLNRVKLKLPYLSDAEETGWARVLQPGSGASRGWNVLPEVNDEVLVGFEHGDLARPFVLGGLVNGVDKPKYGHTDTLKNGKVEARVFNSRVGHEMRFADGGGSNTQFITIHTAGKEATLMLGAEKIDLQADGIPIKVFNAKGSIEITKDGDITLKGANITLKADQDIKIESGANVNVKSKASTAITAQAKLDLKGTAPTTLESSAITTVKGSMVKIN